MDFDPESAKNKQIEPQDASSSSSQSQNFHYRYPYNFGVAVPGFFVPLPSYTVFPNATIGQPVPVVFRDNFSSGVQKDWTGHESLGTASSQIQDLQLSANPEANFASPPQVETRAPHTPPGQQEWPYGTAAHHGGPNELACPQAGTSAYASSAYSQDPTTEQQDWYNEHTTRGHNAFNSTWQVTTSYDPSLNGPGRNSSLNPLNSNETNKETHSSGYDGYDTPLNPASSHRQPDYSVNVSFEPMTPAFGTSFSMRDSSIHALAPSCGPETSFPSTSTTSTTSPVPSPTNVPSPDSARHPCQHCPSTFARQGDLRRHEKIHFPERYRKYHCWELGCLRNGRNGFTRRDKLRDHVNRVHGIDEYGGRL